MSALACMLCGAAGSRELFLSILAIFLCMLGGTLLMLIATIVNGDFKNTHNRERPLEAEEEARTEEALAEEASRGR